jgi:MFS family permease
MPLQENRFKGWPKRLNLVILFFTSNLVCYIDRINISVTAPVIMKEYGWNEVTMGIILSSFFMGYTLLQIPGGWLADYFIGRTGNITLIRKTFHSVSLLSASVFLILLAQADTKPGVIILVTLALGMLSMTGSSTGPNAMDIGPRYAGIIMGMQTTAGNIAGVIVPVVVGFIVALTNRWDMIFYIAAGILIFGVAVWNIFATGRQVLD